MVSSARANWFGTFWILLGVFHAFLAILLLTKYEEIIVLLFAVTLWVFPLRYFLIEKVLRLRLEKWTKWTGIGTALGTGLAVVSFVLLIIYAIFCCLYRTNYSFFENLLMLNFYPVFRLSLLWVQGRFIPKFEKNAWFIDNLIGVGLLWFALAFFVSNGSQPVLGAIVGIAAVAISEFMTATSLITIKANEEKRKVEEL